MKIKLIRESDFNEIEVDVSTEHYTVAQNVYDEFGTNTGIMSSIEKKPGIMVSEDGKKMKVYHKVKNRIPGEQDSHAYLITIEKIDE